MAKEEKKEHEGGEHKKAKLKLRGITTHKADDGGFVHQHHYESRDGAQHSRFGGVSSNMQDLHDHMDDHMGPGAEQEPPEEPAQPEAAPAADPGAAAAAPPAGAAPQG